MKIIALSPNYWGRGDTIFEALTQLKKAGGGQKDRGNEVAILMYPGDDENPYIDDMGIACYKWSDEEMKLPREQRPRPTVIGKGTFRGNSITFINKNWWNN